MHHCCLIGVATKPDVPAGGVSRRVSGLRNGNGVWMPYCAAVIGLLLALGVGLASTPQHVAHADTAVTGDAAYTVEDFTDMSDLAWRNGNQCESRFDWPVASIHRSNNSSSGRSTRGHQVIAEWILLRSKVP